jgi:hypothetical protein
MVIAVCVAVLAVAVVATAPMLALIDAQTAIDALFWTPASAPVPTEDVAVPDPPVADRQSPRAPPLA